MDRIVYCIVPSALCALTGHGCAAPVGLPASDWLAICMLGAAAAPATAGALEWTESNKAEQGE